LARGEDLRSAASDLETALAGLRKSPAPLEAWKACRVLALLKRRLGDEAGARASFEEAARSVRTIAAGTRDEMLRAGFLALPEVLEVLSGGGTTA
jgi:hypothetical protein